MTVVEVEPWRRSVAELEDKARAHDDASEAERIRAEMSPTLAAAESARVRAVTHARKARTTRSLARAIRESYEEGARD